MRLVASSKFGTWRIVRRTLQAVLAWQGGQQPLSWVMGRAGGTGSGHDRRHGWTPQDRYGGWIFETGPGCWSLQYSVETVKSKIRKQLLNIDISLLA